MEETIKCQCDKKAIKNNVFGDDWFSPEEQKAREHEPNQCQGTYLLQEYIRDGKPVFLCSVCCLSTDVKVV